MDTDDFYDDDLYNNDLYDDEDQEDGSDPFDDEAPTNLYHDPSIMSLFFD